MLARLLLSLSHDWALGVAFADGRVSGNDRRLEEFLDVLWKGLHPREA